MSDLNLKVHALENAPPGGSRGGRFGSWVNTWLLMVCVVGIWWPLFKNKAQAPKAKTRVAVRQGYDEELVLRLKKAGAYEEAAEVVDSALRQANMDGDRRASLYKLQGDLYREADQFNRALACYYRAESSLENKESPLAKELSRRVVEILSLKGNRLAVNAELAQRNREKRGEEKAEGDPVLVRIDSQPFALSDFEADLSKYVDGQLQTLLPPDADDEERTRVRRQLEQQWLSPSGKRQYLQQWIQQEVLTREALAWKIDQHPDFEIGMKNFRRSLLQKLYLQKQLAEIPVDESDLKNHVAANRGAFGLSTDPGGLDPQDFARVRPEAEKQYLEMKRSERASALTQDLQQRYSVEVDEAVLER